MNLLYSVIFLSTCMSLLQYICSPLIFLLYQPVFLNIKLAAVFFVIRKLLSFHRFSKVGHFSYLLKVSNFFSLFPATTPLQFMKGSSSFEHANYINHLNTWQLIYKLYALPLRSLGNVQVILVEMKNSFNPLLRTLVYTVIYEQMQISCRYDRSFEPWLYSDHLEVPTPVIASSPSPYFETCAQQCAENFLLSLIRKNR